MDEKGSLGRLRKKARTAAHVKVLERAEELQQRQAAFPSQKCRGTHTKGYGRAYWFVVIERPRGKLGIWLLSLRFGGSKAQAQEEDIT